MSVSHASIHPVEEVPRNEGAINVPWVRMKETDGTPGTSCGLCLRFSQLIFAVAALSTMASNSDFPSVTAFCYLVAATGLQSLWSFPLAIIDIYALLVRRSLQNYQVVSLFTIGDGVTSTLIFAAACASMGITNLIDDTDMVSCSENQNCQPFKTATAMALICWITTVPSFLVNFCSLASR